MAARAPVILFEGRFWAEEGAIFFQQALGNPWPDVLRFVSPQLGYYNAIGNASVLAASRLASLEHAPLVTAWTALAVQCVPAAVLAFGMVRELRTLAARGLAILGLLWLPLNAETWLNTINAQSYLALATALLLVSDTGVGVGRIIRRLVLAMAGLSGIVPLFFLPLYVLRTWQDRDRERGVQAAVLTLTALVQLLVLLALWERSHRQLGMRLDILAGAVYVKSLVVPLLGIAQSNLLAKSLLRTVISEGVPVFPLAITALAAVTLGLVIYRSRSRDAALLVTGGTIVLLLGFIGALEQSDPRKLLLHLLPWGGERYYFVPNQLLFLGLLIALRARDRFAFPLRIAGAVLLLWTLSMGARDYLSSSTLRPHAFTGPRWPREVARWRVRDGYRPRLWPASWIIDAPPPR